jgi:septum formation topological specificity factor MinE
LTSREEELIFSGRNVDDIFGDSIESAEEAEERYQQLYETERRRSRLFGPELGNLLKREILTIFNKI